MIRTRMHHMMLTQALAVMALAASGASPNPSPQTIEFGRKPQVVSNINTWQSMFQNVQGMKCADGWWSVPIPGGNAFSTGDGYTTGDKFIHNSLVIQMGNRMYTVNREQESIPNQANGSYYWGGPMVYIPETKTLWESVHHMTTTHNNDRMELVAWDMSIPASPVIRSMGRFPETGGIKWGAGLTMWGGIPYVYGIKNPAGYGREVYVAKANQNFATFQFWNGSTWGVRNNPAMIVSSEHGPEDTFQAYGSQFSSIEYGPFGNNVSTWSATAPQGPYTRETKLVLTPYTTANQRYLGFVHGGILTTSTGRKLVTVSQNHGDKPSPEEQLIDMKNNPHRYMPIITEA